MSRESAVQFTDEVVEFILDKMCEGYDISQICSKWPDKVPHRKSIYRKSLTDESFAEKMNQAYTVLLMIRMDDLHEIANVPASQAYPELDWREAEATLKRRMDESKFVLGKMGPILSKRFDRTQKLEIEGKDLGPQLTVINYYKQDDTLKLPNEKVIEHEKD